MNIELGMKVKCLITEVEGIAVDRSIWLHGCTRIGVQRKPGDDGKMPQQLTFDEPQLIVTDKTKVMDAAYSSESLINLGDEALDPVTGFHGIVIGRCFYINGCYRLCLQPKHKSGTKKLVLGQWFDEPQIKRLNANVIEEGLKTTGGPVNCSPSINY